MKESMPTPPAAESIPGERQLPRIVLIALLLAIAILIIHLCEQRTIGASHDQARVSTAAHK